MDDNVLINSLENGDVDEALKLFKGRANASLSGLTQQLQYWLVLWKAYEYEQAEAMVNQLIHHPETSLTDYQVIAAKYFQLGRFHDAANIMNVAVERSRENAGVEATVQLAGCLERIGQFDQATEVLNGALKTSPRDVYAIRLKGHLLFRQSLFSEAAQVLADGIATTDQNENWPLHHELAQVFDRLGNYAQAWNHLEAAKSQLAPRAVDYLKLCDRICERQWSLACSITEADVQYWYKDERHFSEQRRVAVLCGFPRSGTTLLESFLAAHEDILTTDESGIVSAQFTNPLVWQAPSVGDALIELRGFDTEQLDIGRGTYWQFTERHLQQSLRGKLVVEKDPLLLTELAVFVRLFPSAPIIVALRDPRDVVLSFLFTMVPLMWSSAPSVTATHAAKFYSNCMRHLLVWQKQLGSQLLTSSYEDLIARPDESMQKICDFIGVPYSAQLTQRQRESERIYSTPSYHAVNQPIQSNSVKRWQSYERQLEPVAEILEPYIRMFGYE